MVIRKLWGILAILWILAGCSALGESESSAAVRDDLEARLTEAQQSQAAALALWDRIIFGEVVSCQDYIPVPELVSLSAQDLETYPNARAVQDRLNAAIQSLRNSSDLWNIECNAERPEVPLSMAEEGRANALAASDPLSEAAALLAAW